MVPTVRAESIGAPLRRALEDITGDAVAVAFALARTTARLRAFSGTTDYAELALLPGILSPCGWAASWIDALARLGLTRWVTACSRAL
jgi:hypothetical protein